MGGGKADLCRQYFKPTMIEGLCSDYSFFYPQLILLQSVAPRSR